MFCMAIAPEYFVLHACFLCALKNPVVTPMHAISPQPVNHDDFSFYRYHPLIMSVLFVVYYRHSREF